MTYWLPCDCVQLDDTPDRSCRACKSFGLRLANATEIAYFLALAASHGALVGPRPT